MDKKIVGSMNSEQMPSPLASEAADVDVADTTMGTQSARSPTPATETAADCLKDEVDIGKLRRKERGAIKTAVKSFTTSSEGRQVDPRDRVPKLFELRERELARMKREGIKSLQLCFPAEFDEEEERDLLVKAFSKYISNSDASGGRRTIFKGKECRGTCQDIAYNEEADGDDEELAPIEPMKFKMEVKEEKHDDLAGGPKVPKSGVVAGMAITRGFSDARLATTFVAKTNVSRTWKQIDGKWVPVPLVSFGASTASVKRKSESVDPEVREKKIKLG